MVAWDAEIATYILASKRYGTLYTGVSSQLLSRIVQHREKVFRGFTAKYGVVRLVWFERHAVMQDAIQREKSLKRWPRAWKVNLIERDNPHWDDLYLEIVNWTPVPRQFDDWPVAPTDTPSS